MNKKRKDEQEKLKDAVDKFVVDWYEDVIHARHLERTGQEPPDWMRAGWHPDGRPVDPPPVEPDNLEEDEIADDLLLDEMMLDDLDMFD